MAPNTVRTRAWPKGQEFDSSTLRWVPERCTGGNTEVSVLGYSLPYDALGAQLACLASEEGSSPS